MGGHGEAFKATKYHSIDDIPDELISRTSKRDPENAIYRTRRWVDFKKKQILFTQNDGIPNYKRTLAGRYTYYAIWASSIGLFFFNIYRFNQHTKKK